MGRKVNPIGFRLKIIKDWDARWPAMSRDGRIAFTLGADLYVFNVADNAVRKVDVELPSDFVLTRERYPEPGSTVTFSSAYNLRAKAASSPGVRAQR